MPAQRLLLLLPLLSIAAQRPALAQERPSITIAEPRPILSINRCDALGPQRDRFDRIFATTVGLDDDRVRDISRAWQDTIRAELDHDPGNVDLHYLLAAVIAIEAEIPGGLSQVRSSKALHAQTQVLLALDPDHVGALFFIGRLHTAVLGMGRIKRWIATTFLGAGQFAGASWDEAQELLEIAATGDPCAADHHYELARLHHLRGDDVLAEQLLQSLLRMELDNVRDRVVKERARSFLDEGKPPREP